MKLLAAVVCLAGAIASVGADNLERSGPVHRKPLAPRHNAFPLFPNGLNLVGRQTGNCSIGSTLCGGTVCCSIGDQCCAAAGGCCDLLGDCCQDGCCEKGYFCDADENPDKPCACYGSLCPGDDDDDDSDYSGGSSSAAADSPNAATGIYPGSMWWTGFWGVIVAGAVGFGAVAL